MSDSKERSTPAISKVSDLAHSGAGGRPAAGVATPLAAGESAPGEFVGRDLPHPMKLRLHGGERVRLLETQVYYDKVVIRAGELGRALHPSSQAASWVVHFPRVGPKPRVVPEPLLELVENQNH